MVLMPNAFQGWVGDHLRTLTQHSFPVQQIILHSLWSQAPIHTYIHMHTHAHTCMHTHARRGEGEDISVWGREGGRGGILYETL